MTSKEDRRLNILACGLTLTICGGILTARGGIAAKLGRSMERAGLDLMESQFTAMQLDEIAAAHGEDRESTTGPDSPLDLPDELR